MIILFPYSNVRARGLFRAATRGPRIRPRGGPQGPQRQAFPGGSDKPRPAGHQAQFEDSKHRQVSARPGGLPRGWHGAKRSRGAPGAPAHHRQSSDVSTQRCPAPAYSAAVKHGGKLKPIFSFSVVTNLVYTISTLIFVYSYILFYCFTVSTHFTNFIFCCS